MSPELPVELVSLILSFLTADKDEHRDTWKALCLTCSAFKQDYQALLFKRIRLVREEHSAKLLSVLQSSPHLAAYTKELEIYEPEGSKWLGSDPFLLELVGALQLGNLTHLTIHRDEFSTRKSSWKSFQPRNRYAVIRLIKAPNLTHLTLRRVPVPLPALTGGRSLKHLEIVDKNYDYDDEDKDYWDAEPVPSSFRSMPLETLCILDTASGFYEAIEFVVDHFDLGSLQTLKMTEPQLGGTVELARDLLPLCCESLRTLALEPTPEMHGVGGPVDIGECKALENLELWVDISSQYEWREAAYGAEGTLLHGAKMFLSDISTTNGIKMLKIWVSFDISVYKKFGDIARDRLRILRDVVELALNPERFPYIGRICVSVEEVNGGDIEEVQGLFADTLAGAALGRPEVLDLNVALGAPSITHCPFTFTSHL